MALVNSILSLKILLTQNLIFYPKKIPGLLKKVKVTFFGQMDGFIGLRGQKPIGKEVFFIIL